MIGRASAILLQSANKQKLLLVASLLIAAGSGFIAIPVVARIGTTEELTLVSVLLMLGALLGVIDPLRAPIVRAMRFSTENRLPWIVVRRSLSPAFNIGIGIATAITLFAMFLPVTPEVKASNWVLFFISVVLYFMASPYWACLDALEQVGTGQLNRAATVAVFLLGSVFGLIFGVSFDGIFFSFFVSMTALFLGSLILSKRAGFRYREANGPTDAGGVSWSDLWSTGSSGLIKSVLEVLDRVALAISASPGIYAAYAASYEVISRLNSPAQLAASYLYPKLCSNSRSVYNLLDSRPFRDLLWVSAVLSLAFWALLLGGIYWGERATSLYLGSEYGGFSRYALIAVAVSGTYALAFGSQAMLRALGLFRTWEGMLIVCLILVAAMIGAMYSIQNYEIVFAAMILTKSAGACALLVIGIACRHIGSFLIALSSVVFANFGLYVFSQSFVLPGVLTLSLVVLCLVYYCFVWRVVGVNRAH